MICNKEQLADIIGVDARSLSRWQKDGLPVNAQRGRENLYDTRAVIAWIRTQDAAKSRPQTQEDLDAEYERARKDREIADRYAIQNAQSRGELIPTAEAQRVWLAHIGSARSRLLSIPSKCAPLIAAEDNPAICMEILDIEIRDALEQLAGNAPDAAGVAIDSDGGNDAGDEPKAKPGRKYTRRRSD